MLHVKSSRLPILALAIISLLAGMWAGLGRIGWGMPVLPIMPHHGAIMVGSFLGTLISFEKVIPLKRKGLYAVPLLSGASLVLFLLHLPSAAFVLLAAASLGLSGIFAYYLVVNRTLIYLLMLIGALSWLAGNIFLGTKNFYPAAFPWWSCFALFVITAERLELMKFLPVSKSKKMLVVFFLSLCLMGAVLSFHGIGSILSGEGLVTISIWLLRYDLVGITIRKQGLTQFIAIALLCGYCAMALTGVFYIALSSAWLGYDVVLHSFFLGFVFSMIFAHGPIILPGVLGISLKPYHKVMYAWLILLHVSWLFRVLADLSLQSEWRKISGLLSGIAILGYFVTLGVLIFRERNA